MPSDLNAKGISRYNMTIEYQSIFQTNFLGQAVTGKELALYGVNINRIEDGMMALGFNAWNRLRFCG